ncbi:hypothetical protein N7G274_001540 [Stereocaulon virgatum]|uniref:Uncharacterized protein n=1 Tax=Stereocaulon virgatum TaxID=373712 RepID=A0ABR4AJY8_9LECA
MAPSRVTKPRHIKKKAPTQITATDEEGPSQQSFQSSEGDDKVVKMAEKMRRDVCKTVSVQPLSQVHPGMLISHQAKARQRSRRASIIRSYEENMQRIEDDINTTFDEISRRTYAAQLFT